MTAEGTPLHTGFTFFYMRRGKASKSFKQDTSNASSLAGKDGDENSDKQNQPSYFDAVKQIGTCHTVEEFWAIYNHLVRPADLPSITDYHCFREGIEPTWEDPNNAKGGKWIVRLKKGLASRYWEEILLALLGEQFTGIPHDEICGAVVSCRYNEDILSVWNRSATNRDITDRVRESIKRILRLPREAHLEYKYHQMSLVDKSSFRNTEVWRPKSAGERDNSRGRDQGERRASNARRAEAPKRSGSWGERPRASNSDRAWR